MAWEYLHFKDISESEMKRQMGNPSDGKTPLQAFLDMYGASNWELIYVGQPSGSSYELIFKQKSA
jgi:hypothetical protein